MAAITFKLSTKGGDTPHVIVMFRAGTTQRVRLQARTDLVAYRPLWKDDDQRHNKKNAGARLQQLTYTDGRLGELETRLDAAYIESIGAGETIDKAWLAAQVERILHPEREQARQATIAAANRPPRLMEYMRQFLKKIDEGRVIVHENRSRSKGKPIGPNRRRIYAQTAMHLANYLQSIGRDDLDVEELNRAFADGFMLYLQNVPLAKNTIWSRFRDLIAMLRYLAADWAEVNETCPMLRYSKKFSAPKETIDNIALNFADLQRLAELDLHERPSLERVRDHFLLLAWTGQRYSDLPKLTASHIVTEKGIKYFKLRQRKTEKPVLVRIFDEIVPIMEKYDYEPPKPISNQKFNICIKKVCEMAGLTEPVTIHQTRMSDNGEFKSVEKQERKCDAVGSHTGRRSFATNMYEAEIPLMEIMAITGHSSIETLRNYIKKDRKDLAVKAGETYEAWKRKRNNN